MNSNGATVEGEMTRAKHERGTPTHALDRQCLAFANGDVSCRDCVSVSAFSFPLLRTPCPNVSAALTFLQFFAIRRRRSVAVYICTQLPCHQDVTGMPEQAALQERLAALFENSDGKVTLASLLRAVPDIDERRSWRFFFALFQTVLHLEQGTQEHREGHAYYQRYVKPDRCVRHAAGLRFARDYHRSPRRVCKVQCTAQNG